jgi:hypothetical protein
MIRKSLVKNIYSFFFDLMKWGGVILKMRDKKKKKKDKKMQGIKKKINKCPSNGNDVYGHHDALGCLHSPHPANR